MNKGEIVLVPFPFTDLSGNKLRPALVLVSSMDDVTVAFITTQIQWREETDIILSASAETGLKKESLIRLSKLATIDKDLVIGRLGQLEKATVRLVNDNLRKILKIDEVN